MAGSGKIIDKVIQDTEILIRDAEMLRCDAEMLR